MKRRTAMLLGAWLMAGCSTPGFLYTDITLPLTVDMDRTPRAADASGATLRIIRAPVTGAGIRAEWSDRSPGETAQIGGLDTVSYADVHRHSIVGGIWGSATVLVYGDHEGERAPVAAAKPPPAADADRE
jgi:hypothetical protein